MPHGNKLLSIVIPAHNEEGCIESTVRGFSKVLSSSNIEHEFVVVNDHSTDSTERILEQLSHEMPNFHYVNNLREPGFGRAVVTGFENFNGSYVALVMADMSDDPSDLVQMYNIGISGYDCVFGSRFMPGAIVIDYPLHKLFFNRIGNKLIQILFFINYNDITNAFKFYSRDCLLGLKPFLGAHFNLTVELPLKAIIRGYSYKVIPTNWTNRKTGISKFRIKELSFRYFFIVLYCLLEKYLSMGDYTRKLKNS